jgi:hypothetical protein
MAGHPVFHWCSMTSRMIRVLCAGVATLAIAACHSDATGPGDGGSPLPPGIGLKLNPFITAGLSSPVFMTQPLDDGRIFVVEQGGRIRIVRNGVLLATPFLDISTRVLSGGERRSTLRSDTSTMAAGSSRRVSWLASSIDKSGRASIV